jgi:lipoprotein-anchoring transpeptidase ErfK/SrfK
VRHLGRPASHGCVRLETANAELFFNAVADVGMERTAIIVEQ